MFYRQKQKRGVISFECTCCYAYRHTVLSQGQFVFVQRVIDYIKWYGCVGWFRCICSYNSLSLPVCLYYNMCCAADTSTTCLTRLLRRVMPVKQNKEGRKKRWTPFLLLSTASQRQAQARSCTYLHFTTPTLTKPTGRESFYIHYEMVQPRMYRTACGERMWHQSNHSGCC